MTLCCDITGVVLAGGKSSRMGSDKALLPFQGKPLVVHQAETLQSVFAEVIVIANDAGVEQFVHVPVHTDIITGAGPLGGLHAATAYSHTTRFFVLPCDMPFISVPLLRYLLAYADQADIVVPRVDEKLYPTVGLYSTALRNDMEDALQRGDRSLARFVRSHQGYELPLVGRTPGIALAFSNLNTPEEYQAVCESEHATVFSNTFRLEKDRP